MNLCILAAVAATSFFKPNDVWVLQGDSITFNDTYRQTVLAALEHYHPGCGIRAMNVAVWGQLTDEAKDRGGDLRPTVVTIMLGMNDVIHRDYPRAYDFTSDAAAYAEKIRKQVKTYKEKGAAVVLMKPTYTDETEFSYFAVHHTRRGLKAYGSALEKVATEEGCEILPVAEDFEAGKPRLGKLDTFIADGVHPLGHGQYQLAKSLIERLGVALPLGDATSPRRVRTGALSDARVRVTRAGNLLVPKAPVDLRLDSDIDGAATLVWSVRREKKSVFAGNPLRGELKVTLTKGTNNLVRLDLPAEARPEQVGAASRLFVSVRQGNETLAMTVIDLAEVPVFDLTSGVAAGTIPGVGRWKIETRGPDLWVSGETFACAWPKRPANDIWMNSSGMNGLQTFFDFRPPERFAENSCDHDVSMVNLNVLDDPWSVMPFAWVGRRVQDCLRAHAEKTEKGFIWRFGFCGRVNDYTCFDISALDYFGAQVIFQTYDGKRFNHAQLAPQLEDGKVRIDPTFFLNATPVFDRRGNLPKPSALTVSAWTL